MRRERPAQSRRSAAPAAIVLVLAASVAACGGSGSSDESASAKTTQATPSADSTTPSRDVGADVTATVMTGLTCQPDETGLWSAQMTMKNSSDAPQAYLARVAVIHTDDADVVGRRTLRVGLEAGQTLTVPFEELALGGPDGLSCDPLVKQIDD